MITINKKLFYVFFCMCILSPAWIQTVDCSNLNKRLALSAALGSGETVTLTKDDLGVLLGQEQTQQLFTKLQKSIDDFKTKEYRELFWNSLRIGFFIALTVACTQIKMPLGKRLVILCALGGLLHVICNVAETYYS